MSTQIDRISELAKEDPKRQFISIAHLITAEALYAAFRGLRKKASAGVDGVTYQMSEKDAARDIHQLHERRKVPGTTAAQDLHPQGKREGEYRCCDTQRTTELVFEATPNEAVVHLRGHVFLQSQALLEHNRGVLSMISAPRRIALENKLGNAPTTAFLIFPFECVERRALRARR